MTFLTHLQASLSTAGYIVVAMALVSLLETAITLHRRGPWHRAHLKPNLALTLLTFATNLFFNAALVLTLETLAPMEFGALHALALPTAVLGAIAVVALDFSFYVAHVSMHHVPAFWRFHQVHHSDPVVDVTTTIRQHPGEGVIRYAFMSAFAIGLGVSPGAFAVYRGWSALHGLLEHANIRVPLWLDRLLVLVVSTPHMHKLHHSRVPAETDTNYSNLFSFFDRLFSTFTPSARGVDVVTGLEGYDDPATQTTRGLLALPFREVAPAVEPLAGAGVLR